MTNQEIIIYNTDDGKVSVSLMTKEGNVWLNQNHLAELFDTSIPNISMHISNVLKDNELNSNSVVKDYLTTAADGKVCDKGIAGQTRNDGRTACNPHTQRHCGTESSSADPQSPKQHVIAGLTRNPQKKGENLHER